MTTDTLANENESNAEDTMSQSTGLRKKTNEDFREEIVDTLGLLREKPNGNDLTKEQLSDICRYLRGAFGYDPVYPAEQGRKGEVAVHIRELLAESDETLDGVHDPTDDSPRLHRKDLKSILEITKRTPIEDALPKCGTCGNHAVIMYPLGASTPYCEHCTSPFSREETDAIDTFPRGEDHD